jgi:uncharacterized cupredoxin-like copper-binding protein
MEAIIESINEKETVMHWRTFFPLTLVVAGLIAGAARPTFAHDEEKHGGHENHAAALRRPGEAAKVNRTIEVGMNDNMRFNPANITVKQDETIRFVVRNEGKLKHEMVLGTLKELKEHAALMRKFPEMEHADPNMVSVRPGKTGEMIWQFTNAGTFDFACLQPGHFEAGMVGKIAVKR